ILKRILMLACIAWLLAACANEQILPDENGSIIDLPPVVVVHDPSRTSQGQHLPEQITHIPSYNIDLTINPDAMRINGVLRVDFVNTSNEPVDRIIFNMPLNAFRDEATRQPFFTNFETRIFGGGRDFGYIDIMTATVNLVPSAFYVHDNIMGIWLQQTVPPGGSLDMGLVFEARIPSISHRTGANDYAMWLGNFLPSLAVLSDEGWHTYEYYRAGNPFFNQTSNFMVNITTPPNFAIASTGTSATIRGDHANSTTIEAVLVRDFAFAVLSDAYQVQRATSDEGVNISLFFNSISSQDNYTVQNILDTASAAFSYFTERIGANPHNNFEIAEVRLFNVDTQKYPGMSFVDLHHMRSPAIHNTIVRDIAHQWFFNVVGNNPVTEPWLSHGLASFLALGFHMSDAHISAHIRRLHANLSATMYYMEHPELTRGLGYYQSWTDFRNIQHTRGMIFFYALQQEMGAAAFEEFLRAYYEQYAFRIATASAMMDVAERIHGYPLGNFFEQWANSPVLPELPELPELIDIDIDDPMWDIF
ncbi:MAG: M1 family metallopeptidase, partial [Defluviitaleaceae bacterium]|nr:M1 family metallopeptidase [Defluviitaleaceae bacterium]